MGTWSISHLNEAQREAVLYPNDPLLVLAGAGTGKTTAVTYRIAHFIRERGIAPSSICAMTFTNKAAREMRERASKLTGVSQWNLDLGTFHGTCVRLLREFGEHIGLTQSFTIYDSDDQLRLIKQCLNDLKLDAQVFPPRLLRHHIEGWRNRGDGPDDAEASPLDMTEKKALEVYRLYHRRSLESNAVDFGGLLLSVAALLKSSSEVRETLQGRWSHLLVDEYQDTNPVQYRILRLLATPAHSVTVVGDDDQSIYRWRGADLGNILRFEQDFPGARTIRLEENYRSTSTILAAANSVISNNVARKGKNLFTSREESESIGLRVWSSEREEAEMIAQSIKWHIEELGTDPGEIAILYRTNAQSRPLEDALRKIGYIPRIYGGTSFYDRREVKDAIAFLRLLVNPQSDIDFERIVNVPARAVGKTSIGKIRSASVQDGVPMFVIAEAMAASGAYGATKRLRQSLTQFTALFQSAREALDSGAHIARVIQKLLDDSGYIKALRTEGTEEAQDRIENLSSLITALDEYVELNEVPTLEGFLEEVALASDIDGMAEVPSQVSMMTLHAAKGLEFEVVYMPGLEEGMFPHSRSLEEHAALEEERRLCYVGITRSKTHLYLSAARVRTVFGSLKYSDLSRFLTEIPEDLLDLGDTKLESPRPATSTQNYIDSLFEDSGADWDELASQVPENERAEPSSRGFVPGSKVKHSTFGVGEVSRAEGSGRNCKLTVVFPEHGRKVIVARFVQAL
ncbi:MAG: UvrD-helicase domain-containing protein [Myxococcota bacterium]|nr:UvrD-helicase domain-containing protein [Myxococcota bacterium]